MNAKYAILVTIGVCLAAATLEGICAGRKCEGILCSPPMAPLFTAAHRLVRQWRVVLRRIWLRTLSRAAQRVSFCLQTDSTRANRFHNDPERTLESALLSCSESVPESACHGSGSVFRPRPSRFGYPSRQASVWALVPYLIYRAYSVWWIYGLGKLNRPR
jgi:hypothetical protein